MPLLPGKKNIGKNIAELEKPSAHAPNGRPYRQALAISLKTAGIPKRANGGLVTGPLHGATGGRADAVPSKVEDGSHILSAACVSALGDGNTENGYHRLMKLFPHSVPGRARGGGLKMPMAPHSTGITGAPPISILRLAPMAHPHIAAVAPHLVGVPKPGGVSGLPHMTKPRLAKGGDTRKVDVSLSHGEFAVVPQDVRDVAGNGDIEAGHQALDDFQVNVVKGYAEKLKHLPGPIKT